MGHSFREEWIRSQKRDIQGRIEDFGIPTKLEVPLGLLVLDALNKEEGEEKTALSGDGGEALGDG